MAGLLALLLPACQAPIRLAVSPEAWRFGSIDADGPIAQEITVENRSRRAVRINPVSIFECLQVQPGEMSLGRGKTGTFRLSYDPVEDSGDIDRRLIIRADDARREERLLYRIAGHVTPQNAGAASAESPAQGPAEEARVRFHYYHDAGCKGCTVFLVRLIYSLQNEQGIRLRLVDQDISRPDILQAYLGRLDELGVEPKGYPAVIVGNTVLQGVEQIESELQRILLEGLGRQSASQPAAR
jgi:hypothetical protein